jgi:hypothetical protein
MNEPSAQLALFGPKQRPAALPSLPEPVAHRADPVTSYLAGERFARSGKLKGQTLLVLLALRKWPGRSSAELARLAGLDRYAVARRLPNLAARGLAVRGPARRCSVTHSPCITWRPAASKTPLLDRGANR